MERVRALGRNHEVAGERTLLPSRDGNWVVGISRGGRSPARKKHPNEDAALFVSHPPDHILCVADAHWGRESADRLVRAVADEADRLFASAEDQLAGAARTVVHRVRRKLQDEATRSECAALLAVHRPPRLHWAEIGDCRLYLIRERGVRELSRARPFYFGGRGGWPQFRFRTEEIEAGRLLLATDGVPECVYGEETLTPERIAAILGNGTPEEAAEALFDAVYDHGAEDNIAFVLGDI